MVNLSESVSGELLFTIDDRKISRRRWARAARCPRDASAADGAPHSGATYVGSPQPVRFARSSTSLRRSER